MLPQTSPPTLHRSHLRLLKRPPSEPRRQLIPIPELALPWIHIPQLLPRPSAYAAIRLHLEGRRGCARRTTLLRLLLRLLLLPLAGLLLLPTEGTVLGGAVAVLGEGFGEVVGRGCGVGVGGVVEV